MKHLIDLNSEFMPDKELRLFILTQIITPFLDQKAEEDMRLSARVAYKTSTQMIHGPRLKRKGKAVEVQASVVCRQGPSKNLLAVDAVLHPATASDCPSYALHGVLRKGDGGYYLNEFHVSISNS